jgi:hypothetical protein
MIEQGELGPAYDLRMKNASRSLVRIPRDALLEFIEERRIAPRQKKRSRRILTDTIAHVPGFVMTIPLVRL